MTPAGACETRVEVSGPDRPWWLAAPELLLEVERRPFKPLATAAFQLGDATFTMVDCRPAGMGGAQTFTAKSAVGGAALGSSSMYPAGTIDFGPAASTVTAGYQMTFFTCGDTQDTTTADNTQVPFDVRWNVATATDGIKVVTVSARRMGNVVAGSGIKNALFTHPVTLRTVVGN